MGAEGVKKASRSPDSGKKLKIPGYKLVVIKFRYFRRGVEH